MKVSSINQTPIVNLELSSFVHRKCASFMLDTVGDVVHMVVHSSHSVETFFCSRREEFVVVVKAYGVWIKAIRTSVGEEFVDTGGSGGVGRFCRR